MVERALVIGSVVISAALLAGVGCGGGGETRRDAGPAATGEAPAGRLIILGFDGVDPRWLDRWAAEGKLPNTTKLTKAHGGRAYRRLGSTNPPQSPVAWTSFATGTRPGDHGIFDFIARDLRDVSEGPPWLPSVATTTFEAADGIPEATNRRSGEPFWKRLADDGVGIEAINIPYSFPPDPMREGRMLSGLGTPDLRGTNSTYFYVGTDVTDAQVGRAPGGSVMIKLTLAAGAGQFQLEGPAVPGERGTFVRTPVDVRVEGGALSLRVSGQNVRLTPGQPSDFVEITWEREGTRTKGLVRMLALEAAPDRVRLFISPISMHPREPFTPVSYPRAYAAQLADALHHYYKTVGWDHDTSALNNEVLSDAQWLADVDRIEDDRRAMLEAALGRDDWKMLIWVSTATDRVAHMFYRLTDPEHPRYDAALAAQHGDAIEDTYRRMDETIGMVVRRLRPEDTLLILSDHGFHNYRRGLHVNQWLRQQGLLTLRDGAESGDLLANADWSQTKAYALGTGQVYLNMRGRERDGIVSAEDAQALRERIRTGLLALRDTERSNAQVVTQVYFGTDVFQGRRSADAPDLQIAFAENYRTSWESILGGVPAGLFADNDKKWSGDHSASDVRETPGILISNRPLRDDVEIVDLAPTALVFFGRTPPAAYVGESVLAPAPAR